MRYQENSTQIEPREKFWNRIGRTMFELMRRIQNIDVLRRNLIRGATDLVESRLFWRQRIAFSEDKIGHFWNLDLYHEPMDNSNFRSFSKGPQKLKSNHTYPLTSGSAEPKIAPDLPRRPVELFWQSMRTFNNIFHRKMLSEMETNGSALFYSRLRMKVQLTCENGRNTSNTA